MHILNIYNDTSCLHVYLIYKLYVDIVKYTVQYAVYIYYRYLNTIYKCIVNLSTVLLYVNTYTLLNSFTY